MRPPPSPPPPTRRTIPYEGVEIQACRRLFDLDGAEASGAMRRLGATQRETRAVESIMTGSTAVSIRWIVDRGGPRCAVLRRLDRGGNDMQLTNALRLVRHLQIADLDQLNLDNWSQPLDDRGSTVWVRRLRRRAAPCPPWAELPTAVPDSLDIAAQICSQGPVQSPCLVALDLFEVGCRVDLDDVARQIEAVRPQAEGRRTIVGGQTTTTRGDPAAGALVAALDGVRAGGTRRYSYEFGVYSHDRAVAERVASCIASGSGGETPFEMSAPERVDPAKSDRPWDLVPPAGGRGLCDTFAPAEVSALGLWPKTDEFELNGFPTIKDKQVSKVNYFVSGSQGAIVGSKTGDITQNFATGDEPSETRRQLQQLAEMVNKVAAESADDDTRERAEDILIHATDLVETVESAAADEGRVRVRMRAFQDAVAANMASAAVFAAARPAADALLTAIRSV